MRSRRVDVHRLVARRGIDRFHSPSEDEAASPHAGTENSEGSLLASTTMKDAVRPTTTKSGPRVASHVRRCKRSKKGKCGTETAPKSCLARPENQSAERQAQIRERVSKLKPMPPKTATRKRSAASKRKLAETASGRRMISDACSTRTIRTISSRNCFVRTIRG